MSPASYVRCASIPHLQARLPAAGVHRSEYFASTCSIPCKKILRWANVCFSEHKLRNRADTQLVKRCSEKAMRYIRDSIFGILQVRENNISRRNGLIALRRCAPQRDIVHRSRASYIWPFHRFTSVALMRCANFHFFPLYRFCMRTTEWNTVVTGALFKSRFVFSVACVYHLAPTLRRGATMLDGA